MDILFGRNPWLTLLAFFVCGVVLAVVYDVLYVKRLFLGAWFPVLFIDDLIFSLLCCVVFLSTAYAFGNGNIRWYEFPSLAAGFALERLSISRAVRFWFGKLAELLHKLLHLLFVPLRTAIGSVGRLVGLRLHRSINMLYRHAMLRYVSRIHLTRKDTL